MYCVKYIIDSSCLQYYNFRSLNKGENYIDENKDDFKGVAAINRYDYFSFFSQYIRIYANWFIDRYFQRFQYNSCTGRCDDYSLFMDCYFTLSATYVSGL